VDEEIELEVLAESNRSANEALLSNELVEDVKSREPSSSHILSLRAVIKNLFYSHNGETITENTIKEE
jgi:hypothetical protein